MAIDIIDQPSTTVPIPVNKCLRYCLRPELGDITDSFGGEAYVEIQWPDPTTVAANGTAFRIWGEDFEVQSGTAYTANTFRIVSGNVAQTMVNFANMLMSNYRFMTMVRFNYSGDGNRTMQIQWPTCEPQENFGEAGMDFADLEAGAGVTVDYQNGSVPEYVPGYKIVVALLRYDAGTGQYEEITLNDGHEPPNSCGTPLTICFDYMKDIKQLLYTPLPAINDSATFAPGNNTMYQQFALRYGWTYRDENCTVKSGSFLRTGVAKVWNAAFDVNDAYAARLYYPGASLPGGYSHVKFLSSQPYTNIVDINSICWLWFFINKAVQSYDTLKIGIEWFTTGSTGFTSVTATGISGQNGIVNINVSPMFVVDNTPADPGNLVSYYITVYGDTGGTLTAFTETKEYLVDRSCVAPTDLYFLMPPGGIGTISVDTTDREIAQEFTEVLLSTPCVATQQEQASYRGRSMANTRSYESVTVRIRHNWSEDWINYFRDFKASPQRWIRQDSNDGTYIARKFLVNSGGIKIFSNGETVELFATGYLQDIPLQSGTEPFIL